MPFPLSEFDSLSLEPYVTLAKYGRGKRAELFHAVAGSVWRDGGVCSAAHGLKHTQRVQTQSLHFIALLV